LARLRHPGIARHIAARPVEAGDKSDFHGALPVRKTIGRFAQEKGNTVGIESRGFTFNAEAPEIVAFLEIGTQASQLR
jgi:hypothetical protein